MEPRLLLAAVGDRVWLDANYNGLQDTGEPGLAGIVVQLIKLGTYSGGTMLDTLEATTTTDASGIYGFAGLSDSVNYYLRFLAPEGYGFTQRYVGAGANASRDSDVDPTTGKTGYFTLWSAQPSDQTRDCGLTGGPAAAFGYAIRAGTVNINADASYGDVGRAVAVDAASNVYVVGRFNGTPDFDPSPVTNNLTSQINDAFVAKYNPSGSLVWARALDTGAGWGQGCEATGVGVSADGGVYLTGYFKGTTDFDPGTGVCNLTSAGDYDIFVAKLDSSGGFLWAKSVGGTSDDRAKALAVGLDGSVCVTGYFHGTADFDPGSGVSGLTSNGGKDVFVVKLNASGVFAWARGMGSALADPGTAIDVADTGNAIAVAGDGSAYVAGVFSGTADLDPGPAVNSFSSAGSNDIFLTKLTSNGDFVWARGMGGPGDDQGAGVAVAADGRVYTTGYFNSGASFGAGINTLPTAGGSDIFICAFDAGGAARWGKSVGGPLDDRAGGVALSDDGGVYIAGFYQGNAGFDPNTAFCRQTSVGGKDIFALRLDTSGCYVWSRSMGGPMDEQAYGIAVADDGGVYTTGEFSGTADFDPAATGYSLSSEGNTDIFLSRLVDNRAPRDLSISSTRVADHKSPPTFVGSFSTVDPNPNDSFVYTLVAGDGDTDNAMFSISASQLTLTVATDSAAKSSYSIRVQSADRNGLTFQKQFTISVNDSSAVPPAISVNDVSVMEGNSGTTTATFTVTLSAASAQTVTAHYATADESATAGTDYIAASGDLVFSPGQTSKTIDILVIGDVVDEPTRSFRVNLTSANGASIGRGAGVGTITDDDGAASLSVVDVAVPEGNSGTTNLTFTVRLAPASGQTVSVHYATVSGTASAGSDYTAASGLLVFSPGESTRTVSIVVKGDVLFEPDETFLLTLADAVNSEIGVTQATGTILNDDQPQLSIGNASIAEGNSQAATAVVTLSGAATQTVTVNYATADNTALAGLDYTASSGVLTFAPGETTKTINIGAMVIDDNVREDAQTFFINLSSPANAVIGIARGTVTIQDNDPQPAISINDISVVEGDSGMSNAVFTVTLSNPSETAVSVAYSTANASAIAGVAYQFSSGILSFLPGQTSKTVTVAVIGDTIVEPDQAFVVNLAGAIGASIADPQGTGTISNDDVPPILSIADASVVEGNSGVRNLVFTVTLAPAAAQSVSVRYATTGISAISSIDFFVGDGLLTFSPGQVSRTIAVAVIGDQQIEPDETLRLTLSNPLNAVLDVAQATGTILNDDLPSLSIGDAVIVEGSTAPTTVTISLSAVTDKPVNVDYSAVPGTATEGADYALSSGTITFEPGQSSKTIDIQPWIVNDQIHEVAETFTIVLSLPANALIAADTGDVTIQDDDPQPTLSISDVSIIEGKSGKTALEFAVSLSAASGEAITVSYATANGTAVAVSDYIAASGVLTFAPGETSKTVRVMIVGDSSIEPDETLKVNLTKPTNATIAKAQGIGTIISDDLSTVPLIAVSLVSPAGNIQYRQAAAINFGSAKVNAVGPIKVFRVTNTGGGTLKLGKVTIPPGYQLVDGLATSLTRGQSDTFSVKLLTKKAGKYPGTISFSTNVAGKTAFSFPITGVVSAAKSRSMSAAASYEPILISKRELAGVFAAG